MGEFTVSHKAFAVLVSRLTGANPNPDDPLPPGPWDPVIRKALDRLRWSAGAPASFGSEVMLNPQPLPPRVAFALALSQAIVDEIGSLRDLAQVLPDQLQGRVLEGARSRLAQFIDDCGNGRVPRKWPFPWPPPHGDESELLAPADLVVIGAQFTRIAATLGDERLQQDLAEGGARLIETGMAQM